MKVLALSFLFPNRVNPDHGIFVLNRLQALTKYADIKVVNPIPWFPGQLLFERYRQYKEIPAKEIFGNLEVYHPRYFSLPRYCKHWEVSHYKKAIFQVVDDIVRDFPFDLVDMHWTFPDLPAGLAVAEHYQKKSIVTLRGMEAFHVQDNDQRRYIVEQGLKAVDAIVGLSNELKRCGDDITQDPGKSLVIGNGVDTEEFYYIPKSKSRDKLGMKQSGISVLAVGSLIHRKGFDLLVRCIAQLKVKSEFSDIRLHIIGTSGAEGDYRSELYRLIDEKGVRENIVFVGQVANADLKYWYNACDIFCLASRGEGSPNVLIEALACGCPTVTTDVGSAREILNSLSDLGECVPANSEEQLVSAMISVLTQKWNREKNSQSFGCFDWDWCARQVLQVYENLYSENIV